MKLLRIKDTSGIIHAAAELEDGSCRKLTGGLFDPALALGESVSGQRLAPVVPHTIYCIGLNYRQHAEESGMAIPERPVLFMKSPSAVQDPEGPIIIPGHLASQEVDYECELAVVIGKRAKNVRVEDALEYVLGCTCANDVSARDWQKKWGGGQWCRGKTFDTFCPLGPSIVTLDELGNPNKLRIATLLNGERVQDCSTDDMIFSVSEIIAFLSGSTTLLPGTVILTGTPQGVGMARNPPRWLRHGDDVTIEIEKIGALHNPVIDESCQPR